MRIFKSLSSDLIFYQYQRVQITLLAINDILFSWKNYHTLSTPEHQKELMGKMAKIKDTVLDEVKNENIKQGNIQDILLRVFSLNSHLIPHTPVIECTIDSDAWKKKMFKSKFQPTNGKIIVSNKKNGKSFVFQKDSKKFLELLFKSIFSIIGLIIMIPVFRLFLAPTFARYKTTKFWNSFLKLNS